MVTVTLPDGSIVSEVEGITAADFINKHIGEGLFRAAIAAKFDNECVDLTTPIMQDCTLTVLTFSDVQGKEIFWHSSAHVLAMAVKRLFPQAKLTIGPPIEQGFYYDIYVEKPFTDQDISKIEQEMKSIVKENIPFEREELSHEKAQKLFADNEFKLELIEEYKQEKLTLYKNGDFFDLCRGPHVLSTGRIKAVTLTKHSGAYWRADSTKAQLQRIYGISFPSKDLLKEYKRKMEQAALRDHRKIVQDQQLVMFHEFAPGCAFFLEKGTIMYNELLSFLREQYKLRGYKEVMTPQLFNKKLWEISGHWQHYKENMFIIDVEGQQHSLKPMNCPSHCLIFNKHAKSYRDLPFRVADFGYLHRNELSGTLTGLTRVRRFAQDDAHIFCTFDQIEQEVKGVLDFIQYVWVDVFGFDLTYYLSTRPEEKLGDDKLWDKAEGMLKNALNSLQIPYQVKDGDGAFYGPKIDIDLEDALGRKWQCPTCQLDFNLPHRFECQYEGADGKKHEAVMIHRAILGSLERFFAIMVEHFAGKFPLWISPVQVKLLPIADRHTDYCQIIQKRLADLGMRAHIDTRPLTTSKKVREAQLEQVNYIVVIGDSEVENKTVNIRTRDNVVHGEKTVDEFCQSLVQEIKDKK
ncbi:MAG: threonine--tRNA ligase [Candidatus Woesearchaeota archaeon]